MQRINLLLWLLIVGLVIGVQAQTAAQLPKPDPELMKLSPFLGHWKFEGQAQPGALESGGKFTGEVSYQMILGGFFVEVRWTEKGPMGESRGFEIDAYDPLNKNFAYHAFGDRGRAESGTFTISGNTTRFEGRFVNEGKEQFVRGTQVMAPDSLSFIQKAEISTDGKTWVPAYEGKYTRTQPATNR